MKGIGLLRKLEPILLRTSFEQTRNSATHCRFSNYRSNKMYISRKIVSRIRVRVSATEEIDETIH